MIVASLIFGLSILLGALIWKIAVRPGPAISTLEEWESRKLHVNLKTVSLLISRDEEAYLKSCLPADLFRKIQRKRTLLAKQCVERVGENAAMLLQLTERAASSSDAEVAAAARQLSSMAVQVRLNAFLASWWLCLKWIFPTAEIHVPSRCLDCKHLIEGNLAFLFRESRLPAQSPETPVART